MSVGQGQPGARSPRHRSPSRTPQPARLGQLRGVLQARQAQEDQLLRGERVLRDWKLGGGAWRQGWVVASQGMGVRRAVGEQA